MLTGGRDYAQHFLIMDKILSVSPWSSPSWQSTKWPLHKWHLFSSNRLETVTFLYVMCMLYTSVYLNIFWRLRSHTIKDWPCHPYILLLFETKLWRIGMHLTLAEPRPPTSLSGSSVLLWSTLGGILSSCDAFLIVWELTFLSAMPLICLPRPLPLYWSMVLPLNSLCGTLGCCVISSSRKQDPLATLNSDENAITLGSMAVCLWFLKICLSCLKFGSGLAGTS